MRPFDVNSRMLLCAEEEAVRRDQSGFSDCQFRCDPVAAFSSDVRSEEGRGSLFGDGEDD